MTTAAVTLLPAGFTALALGGDQLVTEVRNRYADKLISSGPAVDAGARGASPLWMAAEARRLQAARRAREASRPTSLRESLRSGGLPPVLPPDADGPVVVEAVSSDGRRVRSVGDRISSTR